MKQCPKCKATVSDTAKFCVKCGFNIKKHEEENAKHFCPECGTEFSGGNFCPECGYDITNDLEPQEVKPQKKTSKKKEIDLDDFDLGIDNDFDSALNSKLIEKKLKYFEYSKYKNTDKYIIKKFTDTIETVLVIPDCVVAIGDSAFENSMVTNIVLEEGIQSIGKKAFAGCKYLKRIRLPKSLSKLGDEAFADCINLYIDGLENVKVIGKNVIKNTRNDVEEKEKAKREAEREANQKKFEAEKKEFEAKMEAARKAKELEEIEYRKKQLQEAQKKAEEVKRAENIRKAKEAEEERVRLELENARKAFNDCKLEYKTISRYDGNAKFLIIPPKIVDSIGRNAFANNRTIEKIIIGEGVKKIEHSAFLNCSSLKEIILPSSLMEIEACAFSGCKSLGEINLPDKVVELKASVFRECSSLVKVNISKKVIKVEGCAFYRCTSLKSIDLSNVKLLENAAFSGCKSLEKCVLPKKIGSEFAVGGHVFEDCISLKSVNIPEDLNYIPERLFYNCRSLKSLTFTDKTISMGPECFTNCTGLEEITVTWALNPFDLCTLTNCSNLKLIKYKGTTYAWNNNVKGNFKCIRSDFNYSLSVQLGDSKPKTVWDFLYGGYLR